MSCCSPTVPLRFLWRNKTALGSALCPALCPALVPTLGLAVLLVWAPAVQAVDAPAVQVARSNGGMVVSVSPLASQIGAEVLREGGTAVDAAVATALALAVTWPEAGNIGGGGFMLVHPPTAKPVCIDYRETAPAASTRTMYDRNSSRFDQRAVGTPGTVRGLHEAHRNFGRLPWKRLVMPAAELAGQGFPVDAALAGSLNRMLQGLGKNATPRFAELLRVYGPPRDKKRWEAGQKMVLPDLAQTLKRIAVDGPDAFYRGAIADQLVAEMKRGNGLITKADLAAYRAQVRQPIRGTYRGYDIYGAPPPSSGGVCTVLALNILEPYSLRQSPRDGSRNLHLIAESMRRAFCERARHLGDPAFTKIPEHLTTKTYARKLAATIRLDKATPSAALAPDIRLAPESPDTTHFSVVDSQGMAVANTYTLEASWGSKIVVRGAGFVLNNEMGDFNWLPGVTNRRGRIGTAPNLIAPGKRMLSSQTPTIVARNGRAVLVTGSPGGRTIINTVLSIVLNVLEFEMPIEKAIAAPRMHHQWFPDRLYLEQSGAASRGKAIAELRQKGHAIATRPRQGSAHSIWIDPRTRERVGVADFRRGGQAVGVKK